MGLYFVTFILVVMFLSGFGLFKYTKYICCVLMFNSKNFKNIDIAFVYFNKKLLTI